MIKNSFVLIGCFVLLGTPCTLAKAQLGLLRRDDPQAGLSNPRSGLTNPEAADKEDEDCLAKATDMLHVQACDEAEIKRQTLRMEKAWGELTHGKRPDMEHIDANSLSVSQDLWEKYREATCEFVGSLYYPADMGKHQRTCEWRMTRQRADELQILLKNAENKGSSKQKQSIPPIPLPPTTNR